jgi:predicted nucleotidyltransferase component of viral defense system
MTDKLNQLAAIAARQAEDNQQLYNTIIKEGLHRDILRSLVRSGLSRAVVFQGGTALRLCYGNQRYSEDLDFVSPGEVDIEAIERFKSLLAPLIEKDYGAAVEFKDPKKSSGPSTASGIDVKRWTIKVAMDIPNMGPGQKQKINVEIAEGIPALDARPRAIQTLEGTPQRSAPIILRVSSMEEIMADKIVALIGRRYLKARDIWDIKFLNDKQVSVEPTWVLEKCKQYAIATTSEEISKALRRKAVELSGHEPAKQFRNEMQRFLGKQETETWLNEELGAETMLMEVGKIALNTSHIIQALSSEAAEPKTSNRKQQLEEWRKQLEQETGPDMDQ